jgi:hypothetical protein
MVGAIYKDSLDTYGDNDASPLHTDVNGRLLVAATDNGGALTVDGTVSVTGLLADGHNVTIDNAAAAAAVNIQDGGNTITVDGAVTVTNSTATNLKCEATVAASQTIAVTQDTASSLKMTLGARGTYSVTAIDGVLLDDEPTSVTSSAVTIAGFSRVGIFWTYDETEVGGGVTGTLTVEVSPDNVLWFSAPFFDTAGGATPQTSEVLSDDGSYICWLDRNIPFGYMRVKVTGANTDADDTILTTVKVYATT